MQTEQVTKNIVKFTGMDEVNSYFLDVDKKIIIDCGNIQDKIEFEKAICDVVDPSEVEIVVFTHLHYDHTGNYKLFINANFYASEKEIEYLKHNAMFYGETIGLIEKIKPFPNNIKEICGLEIIITPGHTKGGVCFLFEKENVLFTGDTYFRKHVYGRIDLPNSNPDDMKKSLEKIKELKVDIICPGHNY